MSRKAKTCRVFHRNKKDLWCRACVRKQRADQCIRRKTIASDVTDSLPIRKKFKRDYYADFADPKDVDDYLADTDYDTYAY